METNSDAGFSDAFYSSAGRLEAACPDLRDSGRRRAAGRLPARTHPQRARLPRPGADSVGRSVKAAPGDRLRLSRPRPLALRCGLEQLLTSSGSRRHRCRADGARHRARRLHRHFARRPHHPPARRHAAGGAESRHPQRHRTGDRRRRPRPYPRLSRACAEAEELCRGGRHPARRAWPGISPRSPMRTGNGWSMRSTATTTACRYPISTPSC